MPLQIEAELNCRMPRAASRAYRRLRRLKNPDSFGWWLYGIVRNVSREMARAHKPERPLDSIGEPQARPADGRRDELQALIGELPDKYRLPLTLYFVEQVDYARIAGMLGIKEASVRSRVHRAKAMLRERVAPGRRGGTD